MNDISPTSKPRWLSASQFTPLKLVTSILTVLLPSFLIPFFGLPTPKGLHGSPGKVAALDGLRGLSCWAVFNHHYCDIVTDAYGPIPSESNRQYVSHWPMIAIIWQGTSQVYIFFVLSGYVLSARMIKQIHQRQWTSFHKSISSAVIRRAPRMFLPAIASIIIYSIVIQMGAFNQAELISNNQAVNHTMQIKMGEPMPPISPTIATQAVNAFEAILTMLDPTGDIYSEKTYMWYSGHLWSIPVEFYTSIAMFIVMLGVSRLRPIWRILTTIFIASWCWWSFHVHMFLFLCGMTTAELDIIWESHQSKTQFEDIDAPLQPMGHSTVYRRSSLGRYCFNIPYMTAIRVSMLFMGIWLLSMPKHGGESTPGFMIFFKMMPAQRSIIDAHDAIRAIGAVLTVWPISNISISAGQNDREEPRRRSIWRNLTFKNCVELVLANNVSIYAGRISFGFYLLHGLFVKSLGYTLMPTLYRRVVELPRVKANVPMTDPLTRSQVAWLTMLGYFCIFPLVVWASDLFTRYIDDHCITFARKIEQFMIIHEGPTTTPIVPVSDDQLEAEKELQVNGYALVRQHEEA